MSKGSRAPLAFLIGGLAVCLAVALTVYLVLSPSDLEKINKQIDADGLQLLMSRADVEKRMGSTASLEQGFGGYALQYADKQIRVEFPDGDRYRDKVTTMETDNPHYSILGIRAGDSADKLEQQAKAFSFKQSRSNPPYFVWGRFYLIVHYNEDPDGSKTIRSLRIGIEDPGRRKKVF
ncbi:hypothetical protein [Paenibacillus sp. 32352]|uniref:hypothetical protein n=1 Tax=Paenibacillus sp. 32352 TaxID=1969111 RepID=UPI0011804528|nr:hypothetical protein [Paenibacillus sp. 32352]